MAMRERAARGIWKSPEQGETKHGQQNGPGLEKRGDRRGGDEEDGGQA